MRFLADMGISLKTVVFLRGLGHDAAHLHALGLDRLPDAAILQLARAENRVLLTHDLDFAELIAAGGETLPSVIYGTLETTHPGIGIRTYLEPATKVGPALTEMLDDCVVKVSSPSPGAVWQGIGPTAPGGLHGNARFADSESRNR